MKGRDPYFDNVKILLMVLVVLGHVLPINKADRCNLATYNWIFSFHMPLFVFASGYFTKIKKEGFWYGVLKLFETFVVFSLIAIIINVITGKDVSLRTLIVPQWALWYLISLIWWRLILFSMPERYRSLHGLLVGGSIILSLAGGFLPVGPELSMQRTFSFMPFFMIGYVARQKRWVDRLHLSHYVGAVILIVTWVVFFIININDMHFMLNNRPYSLYESFSTGLILRSSYLALASLLSISFLSVVPHKEYRWSRFGALTLFIYMWHTVILTFRYYLRDKLGLPTSLPFCLFYTVLTLVLIYLMSKIRFFHWLLNPITSFFSVRKVETV